MDTREGIIKERETGRDLKFEIWADDFRKRQKTKKEEAFANERDKRGEITKKSVKALMAATILIILMAALLKIL